LVSAIAGHGQRSDSAKSGDYIPVVAGFYVAAVIGFLAGCGNRFLVNHPLVSVLGPCFLFTDIVYYRFSIPHRSRLSYPTWGLFHNSVSSFGILVGAIGYFLLQKADMRIGAVTGIVAAIISRRPPPPSSGRDSSGTVLVVAAFGSGGGISHR
jgi:hypothetical protein